MAEVQIGSVVGGYRVDGVIGKGGMGIVYRATQLRLDRTVALKFIASELATDEAFRGRFENESRLAASINHPNVVPVHEAGEADGLLYIAMTYIEGRDLRTVVEEEGKLDAARAGRIVDQVAAALDAAHKRGLVHRDVKPGNVLVTGSPPNEHAYLTDFGLTKQIASTDGLTKTGQWVGTLDYVAPEQIEGRGLDARTDVYALACVLHQALTGQVPYVRDSDVAKMYAHMSDPPPRVSEVVPGVSTEFDEVISRGMAKDPADRYPSAGDLGRAAVTAAAGGSIALPERSVGVGAAAPADATRPSQEPPAAAPTAHSPAPDPVTQPLPPERPPDLTPVQHQPQQPPPQQPPPQQPQWGQQPPPPGGGPQWSEQQKPAKPGGRSPWVIVLSVIVGLVLIAAGVSQIISSGVFGGDDDKPSSVAATNTTSTDEDPKTETDRPNTTTSGSTSSTPAGGCANSFIPADQRAQLTDAAEAAGPAVQGTVFYGACEGNTWAIAAFPGGATGVFKRRGNGWQVLGEQDPFICEVPDALLRAWKKPVC